MEKADMIFEKLLKESFSLRKMMRKSLFVKRTLFIVIICFFASAFYPEIVFAQNKLKTGMTWTSSDPFNTSVFIENYGQFDTWTTDAGAIKYAINKGDKIFFSPQGYTIRVDKIEKKKESELEENKIEKISTSIYSEEEEEYSTLFEKYAVHMNWVNCNQDAQIIASEGTSNYYTFGEKGYENVKAKGYKKIIYKNIYSGIDVEYTIPEKGGIKYKLILHPGADASQIKMEYTGDVNDIITDYEGNILINTPGGNIIDHAPQCYYEESNSKIPSSFGIKNFIVSFKITGLNSGNTIDKTIIIDPWTVTPSSLATDNAAYDIAYDDYGNVFVSGGTFSFKLAKYTPSGALIWTFTNPSTWDAAAICYSKFCIIPQSGSVIIGEGFNVSGPMVMKINSSGALVYTTPSLTGSREIWVMFYNRCTGKLVGFGGGTQYSNNMQVIADTNLTSSVCSDFNGYGTSDNDIAATVEDLNGDFYALMSSQIYNTGHLLKSLAASGYTPPCAFDIYTGYDMNECANSGIPGFATYCSGPQTVRENALAVNGNYLFSYDGKTLNAWNKTNGVAIGSVVVNGGYAGGQYRTHEGIAVDDCDNVYVGGTNQVHAYTYNSSSFTAAGSIPMNGEVYDIQIDRMSGLLYVSGLGFVTTVNASVTCNVNQLTVTATSTPGFCNGNASVTASGGITPYTYLWSNGDTTTTINNVPQGWYSVTVTDNSCIRLQGYDSVYVTASFPTTISPDTAVCSGVSVQLTATGGVTYVWSPSGSLNNANISNPIATPVSTTTYYVTISNGTCNALDSVTITISPTPNVSVTNTSICNGVADTLFASGATTYQWNIGGTNSYIVVNPSTTTTYTVTGTTAGCTNTATGTVTVNGLPNPQISSFNDATCGLNNGDATATGGTTYLWSGGQTTATITGLAAGTYTVTVSTGAGCSATTSVTINVITPPTVTATSTDENCGHANGSAQSIVTNGTQPYTYLWSNGQTTPSITGLSANPYTVTVTDADGCTTTASVTVSNIAGPSLQVVTIVNDMCTYGNGSATVNAIGGLAPYTYLWSNGNNTATASNLYAGVFTCTVTDANGCTAMNAVTITNTPGPTVTAISSNEICGQANGTTTVTPVGGTQPYSYMWNNNQTNQTAIGLVQGNYTVTVTDNNGCTISTSVNVMETYGPDAGFSAHPKILTIMDGPVSFLDNSSGNIVNWNWNFGDGSYGSGEETDHPYLNIGTYVVTLIITDNNGCLDTTVDTIIVKDIFTLYIPNAFTPNADGYNDYFTPVGISVDPNKFEMYIFDRWGNVMFQTTEWNETLHQAKPWNGTKDNKGTYNDVVMDVYVYRIKLKEIDGPKHEYIGRISLIP